MELSIEEVLANCGVSEQTISQRHRDELDEQGFTIFHDVIDPQWLAELQETFERLTEEEGSERVSKSA